MRTILPIECEGSTILATLDGQAHAETGWLFVIGGTQTRVGPHRLYERLATRLAEAGHAVIRFDRRGVGDSRGEDPGYLDSGADLAAAAAALRHQYPSVKQLLGFGLCDGATALMLNSGAIRLAGAVLANPWVVERQGELPPAAAIRGHYKRRLLDPKAWLRLLRGGVNLRKLAKGLAHSRGGNEDQELARRFASGLPTGAQIVLAEGDGTAQTFAAAWKDLPAQTRPAATVHTIASASHSFADPAGFEALAQVLLGAVTPRR